MVNTRRVLRPLAVALGLALAAPMVSYADPVAGTQGAAPSAQPAPQHKKGFGHHHRHGDFTSQLTLTDAQRTKIAELRTAAEPNFRAKGQEVRTLRQELRQVAIAPQFDEARAVALSNQAARVDAEFTVMRLRQQNQIYNLLTPEQRAQAEEARKQRFERSKGFKHQTKPASPQG